MRIAKTVAAIAVGNLTGCTALKKNGRLESKVYGVVTGADVSSSSSMAYWLGVIITLADAPEGSEVDMSTTPTISVSGRVPATVRRPSKSGPAQSRKKCRQRQNDGLLCELYCFIGC